MSTARYIERRKTPRSPTTDRSAERAPPRIHRERDYGIGYGNSSGYGSNRHYADSQCQGFFRCR
jgi:hypothetical protein